MDDAANLARFRELGDALVAAVADALPAGPRERAVPRLAALVALDPDEQRATPLQIIRESLDDGDPVPAAWADLGPAVHEAGMAWGAGKAYVVLARRRARTQP